MLLACSPGALKTQGQFWPLTTPSQPAAAKSLQLCPTLCDPHGRQPTRLPRPWDSPGKNTGLGCHFLLQCMKVKSESEVPQSCLTLSDPMDCSLPGSSVHGIFQARVLEWGAIAFSAITACPCPILPPHCNRSAPPSLTQQLLIAVQGAYLGYSMFLLPGD